MTIDQMVALLQQQQAKGRGSFELGFVLDSSDGEVFVASQSRAAVLDAGDDGMVFVLEAYSLGVDDSEAVAD